MFIDAASDFIFWSDVLSQTKFKPWWETIRGYLIAALYTISVTIIYLLNPEKSTVCLPIGNQTKEFDEVGSNNIHAFCSQEIPWFLMYLGYVSLGACVVIHAFYSWWLVVPRVAFTFRSLRAYQDHCDELEKPEEDLKEEGYKKLDKDPREKLRRLLDKIVNDFKGLKIRIPWDVPTIYAVRNFIASIPVAFSIYAIYILDGVTEKPFRCLVESITVDCTYSLIHQAQPYLKCMLILLVVIEIITLVAFVPAIAHRKKPIPRSSKTSDTSSNGNELENLNKEKYAFSEFARKKDYAFAKYFGEHSSPISLNAKIVWKFVATLPDIISQLAAHRGADLSVPDTPQNQSESAEVPLSEV